MPAYLRYHDLKPWETMCDDDRVDCLLLLADRYPNAMKMFIQVLKHRIAEKIDGQ